jgi:hypothetical protein
MPNFTSSRFDRRTGPTCLRRLRRHVATTVLWALTLTGCAPSFAGHKLPLLSGLQPPSEGAKKPSAVYSLQVSAGKTPKLSDDNHESELADMRVEFFDVLRNSGFFSSVSSEGQGELNIAVQLVATRKSSLPLKVLTIVSLLIIPSFDTDEYRVNAKVTLADGTSRDYTLTDSVTTVYGLLMFPVGLFKGERDTVSWGVRRNIWNTLLLKMQQDGLLAAQAQRLSGLPPPVGP